MVIRRGLHGSSEECGGRRPLLQRTGGPRHGESVLATIPDTLASGAAESSDEAVDGALPHGEAGAPRPLHQPLACGGVADQLLRVLCLAAGGRPPSGVLEVFRMPGRCSAGACLLEMHYLRVEAAVVAVGPPEGKTRTV
jgi:hypothetical protein